MQLRQRRQQIWEPHPGPCDCKVALVVSICSEVRGSLWKSVSSKSKKMCKFGWKYQNTNTYCISKEARDSIQDRQPSTSRRPDSETPFPHGWCTRTQMSGMRGCSCVACLSSSRDEGHSLRETLRDLGVTSAGTSAGTGTGICAKSGKL